jgi:hypothetical protein
VSSESGPTSRHRINAGVTRAPCHGGGGASGGVSYASTTAPAPTSSIAATVGTVVSTKGSSAPGRSGLT